MLRASSLGLLQARVQHVHPAHVHALLWQSLRRGECLRAGRGQEWQQQQQQRQWTSSSIVCKKRKNLNTNTRTTEVTGPARLGLKKVDGKWVGAEESVVFAREFVLPEKTRLSERTRSLDEDEGRATGSGAHAEAEQAATVDSDPYPHDSSSTETTPRPTFPPSRRRRRKPNRTERQKARIRKFVQALWRGAAVATSTSTPAVVAASPSGEGSRNTTPATSATSTPNRRDDTVHPAAVSGGKVDLPPPRINLKEFVQGSSRDGDRYGYGKDVGKKKIRRLGQLSSIGRSGSVGPVKRANNAVDGDDGRGRGRAPDGMVKSGIYTREGEVMNAHVHEHEHWEEQEQEHWEELQQEYQQELKPEREPPASSDNNKKGKKTKSRPFDPVLARTRARARNTRIKQRRRLGKKKKSRPFDPVLYQKLEYQKRKYDTPHHRAIMTTNEVDEAWEAFEAIAYHSCDSVDDLPGEVITLGSSANPDSNPHSPDDPPDDPPPSPSPSPSPPPPPPSHKSFTKHHLRRLARLLASHPPPTRTSYLRIRSVVAQIRKEGGRVPLWVWNAAMKLAGRAWRRVRVEDYKAAVGVFGEMVREREGKGKGVEGEDEDEDERRREDTRRRKRPNSGRPDAVTHTTLIDIASRTLNQAVLRHAQSLLASASTNPAATSASPTTPPIPTPRLSHLAALRLHASHSRSLGIYQTTHSLLTHSHPLGTDGLNAVLHAHSQLNRPDIAHRIYLAATRTNWRSRRIRRRGGEVEVEGVVLDEGAKPDWVTHVTMVQCLAYHGELVNALKIFMGLLRELRDGEGVGGVMAGEAQPSLEDEEDRASALARIANPVFRALFLGFCRHARPYDERHHSSIYTSRFYQPPQHAQWTPALLQTLLDCLFSIPPHPKFVIGQRTAYWILTAVEKTGGTGISSISESAVEADITQTHTQAPTPSAESSGTPILTSTTTSQETHPHPSREASTSTVAHDNGGAPKRTLTFVQQQQRDVWSRLQERFGVEAKGRLAKLVQTFS